jgi:hypothetical protein
MVDLVVHVFFDAGLVVISKNKEKKMSLELFSTGDHGHLFMYSYFATHEQFF